MSGFVSSLGGSILQSQAPNMSVAGQVIMSAAIGGTAEALGEGPGKLVQIGKSG